MEVSEIQETLAGSAEANLDHSEAHAAWKEAHPLRILQAGGSDSPRGFALHDSRFTIDVRNGAGDPD